MQLERAAQFERDDTPDQKLDKLERLLAQGTERVAEVAPLFAALLAIPAGDRYPPLNLTPQKQKEKTLEALVEQLVGLARQQPVLVIFEDAHWSDPTSLEALDLVLHRIPEVRALVVITYRPEFEPPWREFAHVTLHTLNRLTPRQVATLVTGVTGGKRLPDAVLQQIAAKTDGVPLFVEELTKTVVEAGFLREAGDHYELVGPLPPLAIPATLHDALMARLDRLAPVKEVAQMGAALGREFAYDLVAAVSPLSDTALQAALEQLVRAGLLFRRGTLPGASYLFKHALVQDTAYTSLLKSRRQQLHTRIAQVLETQFPERVEAEPEVVAHHYTAAGLTRQAIPYWERAGERATHRMALTEACAHLVQALDLVHALPEEPARDEQELAFHVVRGDHQSEYDVARRMLDLAVTVHDPTLELMANRAMAIVLCWLGQFTAIPPYTERINELYDLEKHRHLVFDYTLDPKCHAGSYMTNALWITGYPEQAMRLSEEIEGLARQLNHPFQLVYSLCWASGCYLYAGKLDLWMEKLDEAHRLADHHGFLFWSSFCHVLKVF